MCNNAHRIIVGKLIRSAQFSVSFLSLASFSVHQLLRMVVMDGIRIIVIMNVEMAKTPNHRLRQYSCSMDDRRRLKMIETSHAQTCAYVVNQNFYFFIVAKQCVITNVERLVQRNTNLSSTNIGSWDISSSA